MYTVLCSSPIAVSRWQHYYVFYFYISRNTYNCPVYRLTLINTTIVESEQTLLFYERTCTYTCMSISFILMQTQPCVSADDRHIVYHSANWYPTVDPTGFGPPLDSSQGTPVLGRPQRDSDVGVSHVHFFAHLRAFIVLHGCSRSVLLSFQNVSSLKVTYSRLVYCG